MTDEAGLIRVLRVIAAGHPLDVLGTRLDRKPWRAHLIEKGYCDEQGRLSRLGRHVLTRLEDEERALVERVEGARRARLAANGWRL